MDDLSRLEDERPTARLREAMAHGHYSNVLDELARLDRFIARLVFIHRECDKAIHASTAPNTRSPSRLKEPKP